MKHFGSVLAFSAGALAFPATGQEAGGQTTRFVFDQSLEVVRNPDLTPGGDDTETLSVSRFAYQYSSKTRRDEFTFDLGSALRVPLSEGSDDIDFDETSASVSYVHRAPGTRLSATGSITYRDLKYLRSYDLDEDDDINILNGTGNRTVGSLRLSADFMEDRRFGWGAEFGTSAIRYSNLSVGSTYVDVDRADAALKARFDLTQVTTLISRFGFSQSQEEGSSRRRTDSASFGISHARPTGELRGSLSFESPDTSQDRTSLTLGQTYNFDERGRISYDLGATFGDNSSTYWVGRLDYRYDLAPQSQVRATLNRQVSDADDGAVVIRTLGSLGYNMSLGPMTGLGIDLRYLDRDAISGTGGDYQEYGVSVTVDHKLTKNWNLNVGVGHTTRDEIGLQSASSDSVFFSLKRAWGGKL